MSNRRVQTALAFIGLIIAAFALLFGDNIYLQVTDRSLVSDLRRLFGNEIPLTQVSRPSITPTPYIKGYEAVQGGTRHTSLAAGELIVGTADRFQSDVDKPGQPPCTSFIIRGPIEMDLKVWYGGWDYWANVYDNEFAEILLQQKVSEQKQHPTCPSRGINTVRIP